MDTKYRIAFLCNREVVETLPPSFEVHNVVSFRADQYGCIVYGDATREDLVILKLLCGYFQLIYKEEIA